MATGIRIWVDRLLNRWNPTEPDGRPHYACTRDDDGRITCKDSAPARDRVQAPQPPGGPVHTGRKRDRSVAAWRRRRQLVPHRPARYVRRMEDEYRPVPSDQLAEVVEQAQTLRRCVVRTS